MEYTGLQPASPQLATHMQWEITKCYLLPGKGDILT